MVRMTNNKKTRNYNNRNILGASKKMKNKIRVRSLANYVLEVRTVQKWRSTRGPSQDIQVRGQRVSKTLLCAVTKPRPEGDRSRQG